MPKEVNLKKFSLVELRDMLAREQILLKNKKLLSNLPDKGESIKKLVENIETEIKHLESVETIENSMDKLRIGTEYSHKICVKETNPVKGRFKPHSTLKSLFAPKEDSKITQLMEDAKYFDKTTKLINLPESLTILSQQDERVKEEIVKQKFEKELEKLQKEAEAESESSSDDEYED